MYNFAPASKRESIVFGAARPGYDEAEVSRWMEFMQTQGIQRVCCLLSKSQLANYDHLLDRYRQSFGIEQVCWAPIEDFHIADPELLMQTVLPFLAVSDQTQAPIVVHCAGGIGRTGQVLTAWLIAGRGFSRQAAIDAVRQTGRNPYEAVMAAPFQLRNPWKVSAELDRLLDGCHLFKLPK
jgi:protein-tyrosine phosphatase